MEPINFVLYVIAKLKPVQSGRSRSPEKCSALLLNHFKHVARLYQRESHTSNPVLISNHVFDSSDWANALTKIWLACRACVTCGGWRRYNGPYTRGLPCPHSFDCSKMITGRTRKERTSSAPLSGCTHLHASDPIHATRSTVTRAFGREERTQPRNRLESQTPHVLQVQKFHAKLTRYGNQKPRKAAKRESVLVPRERVVGPGHEHALFWPSPRSCPLASEARPSFPSCRPRARTTGMTRCCASSKQFFFWSLCISFAEEEKSCRTLLQCDVSSANPGV